MSPDLTQVRDTTETQAHDLRTLLNLEELPAIGESPKAAPIVGLHSRHSSLCVESLCMCKEKL